jgi:tetratricopeptide (TPR) repeat protein
VASAGKKKRLRWPYVVASVVVLAILVFGAFKFFLEQPTQLEIETAIGAEEWGKVVSLLNRADLEGDDGRNFFHLGVARMNLGDDNGAIEAFMQADDRGFRRSRARFYVASLYAKAGKDDLAIRWMEDAFDAGFNSNDQLASDPGLQKLAQTAAWRERFESDEASGEPEQALDFLLGNWSINPSDGFGGRNVTIVKVLPGVISESWPSEGPGGGSGVFRLDPETKLWHYSYVDGFGRVYEGQVTVGKQVSISGIWRYADGTEFLRRTDIRVSSGLIDYVTTNSSDDGRTWDDENRRRLTVIGDQARSAF